MQMKTGSAGKTLIKFYETCKLKAYPDPGTKAAPWTIGWGHTGGVHENDVCTQEQADNWFDLDLLVSEHFVNAYVLVPLTQNQFDALVSLLFNVGPGSKNFKDGIITLKNGNPSTLLRKLNAGDYEGAALEFTKWDSPNNAQVHKGLDARRNKETVLFNTPDTPSPA